MDIPILLFSSCSDSWGSIRKILLASVSRNATRQGVNQYSFSSYPVPFGGYVIFTLKPLYILDTVAYSTCNFSARDWTVYPKSFALFLTRIPTSLLSYYLQESTVITSSICIFQLWKQIKKTLTTISAISISSGLLPLHQLSGLFPGALSQNHLLR